MDITEQNEQAAWQLERDAAENAKRNKGTPLPSDPVLKKRSLARLRGKDGDKVIALRDSLLDGTVKMLCRGIEEAEGRERIALTTSLMKRGVPAKPTPSGPGPAETGLNNPNKQVFAEAARGQVEYHDIAATAKSMRPDLYQSRSERLPIWEEKAMQMIAADRPWLLVHLSTTVGGATRSAAAVERRSARDVMVERANRDGRLPPGSVPASDSMWIAEMLRRTGMATHGDLVSEDYFATLRASVLTIGREATEAAVRSTVTRSGARKWRRA